MTPAPGSVRCVIRTFDKIIAQPGPAFSGDERPDLTRPEQTRTQRGEERNTGAMPVGCGRSDSPCLDSGEEGRTSGSPGTTASVRVMQHQHTVLLQIFPRPTDPGPGHTGPRGPLACPTCKPFSQTCCQAEPGWSVLSSLVRTNMNNVWNIQLVKTVARLRYQVSVGPG